jgi:hypothetical protein
MDVNGSAKGGGSTTEVLVTNATGGTTFPTALPGRKWVEIQNLGSNAIYVTVDGTAPVASKARKIAAAGAWVIEVGPNITLKAIADSGAQTTGGGTIVTELA